MCNNVKLRKISVVVQICHTDLFTENMKVYKKKVFADILETFYTSITWIKKRLCTVYNRLFMKEVGIFMIC